MASITSVKQAILRLDGGAFQILCDDWLTRKVGGVISSLGTQAGSSRTTKGTPDSYFRTDDNKYIFVEYTVQQSPFNKMKVDIEKCLDASKTDIQHADISRIICCHTSSNLNPQQDAALHKMCADVGIDLDLYGIDQIASDITKNYPRLAKDHLELPLDSGQILSIDDYLRDHDSNKMVAPLHLQFHHRESELAELDDAFSTTNVVILTGNPGVGKTRIAIEYAKKYGTEKGVETRIIHDRQLPLYDDIQTSFQSNFPCFIVVDDANQITQMEHVLELLKRDNIKLLVTVREYAKAKVVSHIRQHALPALVSIGSFSDEQIKKIVENEQDIKNAAYLDKIASIANGNARLAVLAGKLATENNNLESIADASDLYETYYGQVLDQIRIQQADATKDIVTVGILAFFEIIQDIHIEKLSPLLAAADIDTKAFINSLNNLSELEIVHIYHDRAYQIADQTFGNFVVKYVFVDKKTVPLSVVVRIGWAISKIRTINALNMLGNVFTNNETSEYVVNQLKILWDELRNSNAPDFLNYVKATFAINPTETLKILKDIVDSNDKHDCLLSKKQFEKKRNSGSIDDVIEILGGFIHHHIDVESATELLIDYYEKRPDLYEQFLNIIEQSYTIRKESDRYGYSVQTALLNVLRSKSDGWKNNNITLLFVEISKSLLQYTFSPSEMGRGNTLINYHIQLLESEKCRAYRLLILDGIVALISNSALADKGLDLLEKMLREQPQDASKDVALSDAQRVKTIFGGQLSPDSIRHCFIAARYVKWISRIDSAFDVTFLDGYFRNPKYCMIKILERDKDGFIRYEQEIEDRKVAMRSFVHNADIVKTIQLIDACSEYESFADNNAWDICVGLEVLFETLFEKDASLFLDTVQYYIDKGTPFKLKSHKTIHCLRKHLGDEDLYKFLTEKEYTIKNSWLYLYFNTLEPQNISKKEVEAWYAYIEDEKLQYSKYQDLTFLRNYMKVEPDIIPNTCEYLLHHNVNPEEKVVGYCESLLETCSHSAEEIIDFFNGNVDLLEDVYLTVFKTEQNGSFDYKGKLFIALVHRNLEFLFKYTSTILDNNIYFGIRKAHYHLLYSEDNAKAVLDDLAEHIVKSEIPIISSLMKELIVLPSDSDIETITRRNTWVLHFIKKNSNRPKIVAAHAQ